MTVLSAPAGPAIGPANVPLWASRFSPASLTIQRASPIMLRKMSEPSTARGPLLCIRTHLQPGVLALFQAQLLTHASTLRTLRCQATTLGPPRPPKTITTLWKLWLNFKTPSVHLMLVPRPPSPLLLLSMSNMTPCARTLSLLALRALAVFCVATATAYLPRRLPVTSHVQAAITLPFHAALRPSAASAASCGCQPMALSLCESPLCAFMVALAPPPAPSLISGPLPLARALTRHRILNLYHHLPTLDTTQTTPLVCLLAVVVLPLGPLLGPKLLLPVIAYSPFSLTLLSS